MVNAGTPFDVRVTAPAAESTYAGIVRLVSEAESSPAPFVRLADRYAIWFLIVSVVTAAAVWAAFGAAVSGCRPGGGDSLPAYPGCPGRLGGRPLQSGATRCHRRNRRRARTARPLLDTSHRQDGDPHERASGPGRHHGGRAVQFTRGPDHGRVDRPGFTSCTRQRHSPGGRLPKLRPRAPAGRRGGGRPGPPRQR